MLDGLYFCTKLLPPFPPLFPAVVCWQAVESDDRNLWLPFSPPSKLDQSVRGIVHCDLEKLVTLWWCSDDDDDDKEDDDDEDDDEDEEDGDEGGGGDDDDGEYDDLVVLVTALYTVLSKEVPSWWIDAHGAAKIFSAMAVIQI